MTDNELELSEREVTRDDDMVVTNHTEQTRSLESNGAASNGTTSTPRNISSSYSSWFSMAMQLVFVYLIVNMFFKGSDKQQGLYEGKNGNMSRSHGGKDRTSLINAYSANETMDLYVFLSEKQEFLQVTNETMLVWKEEHIVYGNWSERRTRTIKIPTSQAVRQNGSLYAHVYFVKHLLPLNEMTLRNRRDNVLDVHINLVKYLPEVKIKTEKKLLSSSASDTHPIDADTPDKKERNMHETMLDVDLATKDRIVSYWAENMTVNIIVDQSKYSPASIPAPMAPYFRLDLENEVYYPPVWVNDFWILREKMLPINETMKELTLHMDFAPLSSFKWMLISQMGDMFSTQERMMGMGSNEFDSVKIMLMDTNPYLLGLTVVITLLHSVFDFLAFKNDIAFWKHRKSVEGLSIRTIFLNTFFQSIIFLYLLDNNTSTMIIVSSGIGLLIEMWKIKKALLVTVVRTHGRWPRIRFQERATYVQSFTKKYDEQAFRYLSYVFFPLAIGYAIYSLIYESHKNWYSWVISSLVGFIYTFGFIMMTPQLFINYKMKSVAHMPWKTFTYKAINTFIDDLFAFIIRMPSLHRLACFRDDIIFIIYLYQLWIYPVDKKRANEFGQVGDEGEVDSTEDKQSKGAQSSSAIISTQDSISKKE